MRNVIACSLYGLLVFLGTALLGFVVLPLLGMASGYFTIDAEARGAFSMLTLKAVPYLAGLSILSGVLYRRISERRLRTRAALLAANVVVVWLIGASISLAILG